MKVLLLSKYGRLGASSRLRSLQYLPYLQANGVSVTTLPLFSDAYLQNVYKGSLRAVPEVLTAYFRRLLRSPRLREFDLLWIEKELLPWVPHFFEKWLIPTQVPVLVDYDDAIFHRYDQHRLSLIRTILGGKIDRIMRLADCVTVGNQYLAERARRSGSNVRIIPTSVDLERYLIRPVDTDAGKTVVGWIGTPRTARFLSPVAGALKTLYEEGRVEYRFIGCPAGLNFGFPYTAVPWREEQEVEALLQLDCGIMPLVDAPFERGKCGYKLIQYMACELPVVASPVGINSEIVAHGESGFLATSAIEWYESLRRLTEDADERRAMGEKGRRIVERHYSTDVNAPVLLETMKRVHQR